MSIAPPEIISFEPSFTAEQYRDPDFFARVAVPAMREVACHYADNEAFHYGGRDGDGTYVGACGAFETPSGEIVLLGAPNTKLDPSFEKICAEKYILKKAKMLIKGLGGGRLLGLYVVGPDDQETRTSVLGIDAPTLHPCKGKCQHAIAEHEAIDEDLMIISATRSDDYTEEFYLLKRLRKMYSRIEAPPTSDELVRAGK